MFRKKKRHALRTIRLTVKRKDGSTEVTTERGYVDEDGVHQFFFTRENPVVLGNEDSLTITWDAADEVVLGG